MSNKVSYIYIAQDKYSKVTAKLSRVTDKFRSSLNKVSNSLIKSSTLTGKFKNATARLGIGLLSLGKKFTVFSKKVSGVLLEASKKLALFGLAIGASAIYIGNRLVNAASDAEETASKFNTVFRDISKDANKIAENLAQNYGLASTKSQQLLSDTGDLLTGFGFTQKSALDLSDKVQRLAVDLASFTNFSGGAEGASKALTKALLGERESIKSLGISILEDDVKRKVQLLRSKGMRFATERQAKAYATLQIAIDQSKNAIGDYARTQDGLANKKRLLSQRVTDLSVKLGRILLPIWSKVSDVAIKVVNKLNARISGLGTTISDKFVAVIEKLEPVIMKNVDALITWFEELKPEHIDSFISSLSTMLDVAAGIAKAFNAVYVILRGIGTAIGQVTAAVATFDFSQFKGVKEAFYSDGKLFGLFGDDKPKRDVNTSSKSRTDVNVNLNAPSGVVESVKSTTKGNVPGLNVGLNMVTQ